MTIDKWKSPQDDDPSGVIGDLINSMLCPLDSIKALLVYYDDISPIELIESQISSESGFNMNLMFSRIETLFRDQTSNRNVLDISEMRYIKSIAEKYEKSDVLDWVNSKIQSEFTVAEKPEWVNLKSGETKDVLDYDNWRNLEVKNIPKLDTDTIVDMLRENFNIKDEEADEDIDEHTLTEIANTALKSSSVSSLMDSQFNSEVKYPADPDRMFGPVNKRNDGEECVSGVVKGGCRMLSCRCRDFDQSSDEEPEDNDPDGWFEGICDGCNRKIEDISWCLRYPIIGGGYVGCFCSITCFKIKPSRGPTQIGEFVIDDMFSVIEAKGILDRKKLITPAKKEQQTEEFLYVSSPQKFSNELPI